jgi:glycosyltransferase involved in cell wall biosynthesis
LLAPSIQEGCSNVCLESQARGKYCVVSDAEGMNEIIIDGTTGSITPKGDWMAIADAIENYYQMPYVSRLASSSESIKFIERDYLRSLQTQKWIDFFQKT